MQFSLCWILSQHLQSRRTREKPWRGAEEGKQHILVWLKPSKHSPTARYSFFICDSDYGRQAAHGKTHFFLFSAACVTLPFGGPWISWSLCKMICELCGSCKRACCTGTHAHLVRKREKTSFFKRRKGNKRIMVDNVWATSCNGKRACCRIPVVYVSAIYKGVMHWWHKEGEIWLAIANCAGSSCSVNFNWNRRRQVASLRLVVYLISSWKLFFI